MKKKIKKIGKSIGIGAAIIVGITIVAIVAFFLIDDSGLGEGTTYDIKADLKKVIEIDELYTAEYSYENIVPVYAEDGETLKYYVSYEGKAHAGIHLTDNDIEVNDEEGIITVKVPTPSIMNVSVDPGTLDYMFMKEKYDTGDVSKEAYHLCEQDLEKQVKSNPKIIKSAHDNAVTIIKGLITSVEKNSGYKITVI